MGGIGHKMKVEVKPQLPAACAKSDFRALVLV